MNTSIYIAKRYLFSKKKTHAINIISGISMIGVMIGSAALIIILSAFNGLENLILSLYSNFTPEIKIEARLGKTFNPNEPYFNTLRKDAALFSFTEVLEEKALIQYGGRPMIATIKGVSNDFLKNKRLDSTIQEGAFTLTQGSREFAVVGAVVKNSLGINVHDEMSSMQIFSPKHNSGIAINPMDEFTTMNIYPSGVFSIQRDFDDFVVVPLSFARKLLEVPDRVSSIELKYKKGTNVDKVQQAIKEKIGNDFTVKNRQEQDVELYKTLNFERWSIFMILTFVVVVAVFNIVGTLTMLVIDKRKDIAILTGLGANKQLIQGIFFFEGMMIAMIGCVMGLALGLLFCILQQHYGFIKIGDQVTVVEAYPIAIHPGNCVEVFLTVGIISLLASGISARLSVKGLDDIKQDL